VDSAEPPWGATPTHADANRPPNIASTQSQRTTSLRSRTNKKYDHATRQTCQGPTSTEVRSAALSEAQITYMTDSLPPDEPNPVFVSRHPRQGVILEIPNTITRATRPSPRPAH